MNGPDARLASTASTGPEDHHHRSRDRGGAVRIEDASVSRATRASCGPDGQFFVEDLGSTNGTFVAGSASSARSSHTGDRLQIGPNVILRFAIIDEAEEQLAHQLYEASTKDALTEAFNRKYFVERMAAEVAHAHRHKSPLADPLFDLDHFKKVNDTHGHLAGDVVLRVVAAQVQQTHPHRGRARALRRRGVRDPRPRARAARRGAFRRAGAQGGRAAHHSRPGELHLKATISVGVARSPSSREAATGDVLLHLADERLYRAKASGRNRVVSTTLAAPAPDGTHPANATERCA